LEIGRLSKGGGSLSDPFLVYKGGEGEEHRISGGGGGGGGGWGVNPISFMGESNGSGLLFSLIGEKTRHGLLDNGVVTGKKENLWYENLTIPAKLRETKEGRPNPGVVSNTEEGKQARKK